MSTRSSHCWAGLPISSMLAIFALSGCRLPSGSILVNPAFKPISSNLGATSRMSLFILVEVKSTDLMYLCPDYLSSCLALWTNFSIHGLSSLALASVVTMASWVKSAVARFLELDEKVSIAIKIYRGVVDLARYGLRALTWRGPACVRVSFPIFDLVADVSLFD